VPDVPIVDAHLHLWDPTRFRMPWLDGNDLLDRPYGLADYRRHTDGLDIAAMVYLQVEVAPPYALLEAQWVAEQARADPRLQGMVAWAPLEFGDRVRAFLEALTTHGPLLKGVRRNVEAEPDPEFSARPDFVRAVQLLPEYGLSCDLCIKHWQMPSVIKLVRQCPDTRFMLDHLGKPNIREHLRDPWFAQIAELAGMPHVMCKVSGIVTEADHQNWSAEDLAPYVAHALEVFGEDRVAFGGDWPVVLNASPYRRWVDTLDQLTRDLSPAARRRLWADNARRFYRLT
jgi:L-fuconolactonase